MKIEGQQQRNPEHGGNRRWRAAWFGLVAVIVAVLAHPVSIGILRIFLVIAVPVLLVGLSLLLGKLRPHLRWAPVAGLLAGLVFLVLPGRAVDRQRLQAAYVESLKSCEGTRYIWGGENRLGIDCSGLVRKGLINAHLMEGLKTANPGLVRTALEFWWFDASANTLKEGHRNWTRSLFESPAINQIKPDALLPGDFAVTADGIHALVYIGASEWLEADPGARKVLRVKVPATDNPWFAQPVQLLRWRCLERR